VIQGDLRKGEGLSPRDLISAKEEAAAGTTLDRVVQSQSNVVRKLQVSQGAYIHGPQVQQGVYIRGLQVQKGTYICVVQVLTCTYSFYRSQLQSRTVTTELLSCK
jgi:hypothetical protein